MQRLATIIAACTTIIGVIGFVASSGARQPNPATASSRYLAYPACGLGPHASPTHKCTRGSKVGAFFKSADPIEFTLCVVFPTDRRLCARNQNAEAGRLKVNKVTTDLIGRHKLVWYLPGGRKIVRYFRLVAD